MQLSRQEAPNTVQLGFSKAKVEMTEMTQNHEWLQACRTRATLVVKALCSFKVVSGRRETRLDSEVPFVKISVEDRAQDTP